MSQARATINTEGGLARACAQRPGECDDKKNLWATAFWNQKNEIKTKNLPTKNRDTKTAAEEKGGLRNNTSLRTTNACVPCRREDSHVRTVRSMNALYPTPNGMGRPSEGRRKKTKQVRGTHAAFQGGKLSTGDTVTPFAWGGQDRLTWLCSDVGLAPEAYSSV